MTSDQKGINMRFLMALYEILQDKSSDVDSISDFCRKTSVKNQTISYCKKNERCFSMEDILKLYHHFGYSPNWILLNKGSKKL